MPYPPPLLIEDARVGQRYMWRRVITQADLEATIALTGDHGGYHVDEQYARRAGFRTLITPGLLQAGMLTKLGGDLNFLARTMTIEYLKPVYVGDELEATVEIVEVQPERNRIALQCAITNQAGEQVLSARTSGYLPRREWGVPAR